MARWGQELVSVEVVTCVDFSARERRLKRTCMLLHICWSLLLCVGRILHYTSKQGGEAHVLLLPNCKVCADSLTVPVTILRWTTQ